MTSPTCSRDAMMEMDHCNIYGLVQLKRLDITTKTETEWSLNVVIQNLSESRNCKEIALVVARPNLFHY